VPAAKGRLSISGQRDSPGLFSGVERRHAVAADQPGAEQSFRPWWVAGVVVSSAALAGDKDWPSFPGRPSSQLVDQLRGRQLSAV